MKNCNINIVNPFFYTKEGSMIPSFSYETADFTTKNNDTKLISETIFTMEDTKKEKGIPLAKTITKQEDYMNDTSELLYTHVNKYVEKYKVVNTTFNTIQSDNNAEVNCTYLVAPIPFNGVITNVKITNGLAGKVEVVAARNITTNAIKYDIKDKVLYSKICYLIFKIDPDIIDKTEEDGSVHKYCDYSGFNVEFTTVSYKNINETNTQITREVEFRVPAEAVFGFNPETTETYIKPEIISIDEKPAEVDESGKVQTVHVKFNSLFNIKVDKSIKSEYNNKSSYYTKNRTLNKNDFKSNDVVGNYFASNKNHRDSNEQQSRRNKKFEDAKRRYSEDIDE